MFGKGNTFKMIGKSLFPISALTVGLTSATAAIVGLTVAKTRYENSQKYENLNGKAEESFNDYQESKESLVELNSELTETSSKIKQLESVKANGSITLVQEAELEKLKQQNKELSKSIKLKEKEKEFNSNKAARDAKKAVTTENYKTQSDYKKDSLFFGGINEDNQLLASINTDKYTATAHSISKSGTVLDEMTDKIEKYKDIQSDISDAEEAMLNSKAGSKKYKDSEKLVERLSGDLETLKKEIDGTTEKLSGNKQAMLESSDSMKYASQISDITKIENSWAKATDTMTETERKLNSIDSYFGDTAGRGLKNRISDLAETQNLDQLSKSIENMGVQIDGVATKDIARYFKEMAEAAGIAGDAVEKYGTSMSDIEAAFNSENSGASYESMYEYMEKAKELYDQGLTGTDEFKTVAETMSKGQDFSAETFKANYDNYKKYFTVGDKGNLTPQGINTFADEFRNLGQEFNSTAQAADKMNMSTEMFEMLMGRVGDRGNEFQDVKQSFKEMAKSSEKLQEAKSTLDSLKELQEKTGNKGLKKDIDGWQKELDKWDNDLSTLDEEVIVKMKLEYDLVEIQRQIDEVRNLIANGANTGDEGVKNYAASLALGEEQDKKLREKNKYQGDNADYESARGKFNEYKKKAAGGANNEEKLYWQAQASAVQEYASAIQAAGGDVDKAKESMVDFQFDPANIDAQIAALNDLGFNIEKVGEYDAKFNIEAVDNASDKIEAVEKKEIKDKVATITSDTTEIDGATEVWEQLQLDPKFAELDVNDQATFALQVWNEMTPEEKEAVLKAKGDAIEKADATRSAVERIPAEKATSISANTETAQSKLSSISGTLASLKSKTITITTITKNIIETTKKVKKSFSTGLGLMPSTARYPFNGTAHVLGSAFARGTTRHGNWGLKENLNGSLINELGAEAIVRDGHYSILNNGYPTMTNLKKGDVIFNHKQTEELMKKGYVTNSHAKIYGGAFAHGTVGEFSGSAFAEGTDKEKKPFEDLVDWIEVRLKRLDHYFERTMSAMERSIDLTEKQNKIHEAQEKNKQLSKETKQSWDNYWAQDKAIISASGGRLTSDIVNKIHFGSINLQEYDEKTREFITMYQSNHEKLLDIEKQYDDLLLKQKETNLKALKNITEYYHTKSISYQTVVDKIAAEIELSDTRGENRYGSKRTEFITSQIVDAQNVANSLQKAYDDTWKEFHYQVDTGYVKAGSEEYHAISDQLYGLHEELAKAKQAVLEFKDSIREMNYLKLEDAFNSINRVFDKLEKQIDLMDARDEFVGRDKYQAEINNRKEVVKNREELKKLKIQEQALYEKGSQHYEDLAEEIAKLDGEIYDGLIEIESLKDKIFEAELFDFRKQIEDLQYFSKELEFVKGLLDSDAFFDKKSNMTDKGLASIAFTSQGMANAKDQIAEYTAGIKKLDEMLKSGLISSKEYEETQREFLDGIRDGVSDLEDYKNSLIELYKNQMKAENEALKENIGLRQKALSNMKSYYDYADSINDKTKDINALKAQKAALEGVSNPQALAELKRINAQIADAQKELDKTKKDHETDLINQGYEGMKDDLDKALEDISYEILHSSEKQEEIVSAMLNRVVDNYATAYETISDIIKETGMLGTDDFNKFIDSLKYTNGVITVVNGAKGKGSSSVANNINSSNARYASGTLSAKRGLVYVDDTKDGNLSLGSEAIITNRGVLRQMNAGDTVFNADQVKALYGLSKNLSSNGISSLTGLKQGIYNVQKQENVQNIVLDIKEMIHIDGATTDVLGEIQRQANKVADIISKPIVRELKRL